MNRRSLPLLLAAALALPALAADPAPAKGPAPAAPATPVTSMPATPPVEAKLPLKVLGVAPDRTCAELRTGFVKAGLKEDKQIGKRVTMYTVATPLGANPNVPAPLAKATQVRVICTGTEPAKPQQIEFLLATPPSEAGTVRAGLAAAYGGTPTTQSWTFPNDWRVAVWPRGEKNTAVVYQLPTAMTSHPVRVAGPGAAPTAATGPGMPGHVPTPNAPAPKAAAPKAAS